MDHRANSRAPVRRQGGVGALLGQEVLHMQFTHADTRKARAKLAST